MQTSVPSIAALIVSASLLIPAPARSFCFEEAAARYHVAPELIWSISKWESGHNPATVNYNTNGTYDYGLMGINTVHADELKRIGIPWESLADPCTNVMVGTWLLSKHIQEDGYTWKAIGSYHSKTPSKRDKYAGHIAKVLSNINKTPAKTVAAQQTATQPQEQANADTNPAH